MNSWIGLTMWKVAVNDNADWGEWETRAVFRLGLIR